MRNKYECSLLSKTKEDHKSLYKHIRSQQRIKPAIQALKSENGLTETESEAAEVLQKYFKSVFVVEGSETVPTFPTKVRPGAVFLSLRTQVFCVRMLIWYSCLFAYAIRKFWHSYLQRTQNRYSCLFCVRRRYSRALPRRREN